jgi:hypothetical protein
MWQLRGLCASVRVCSVFFCVWGQEGLAVCDKACREGSTHLPGMLLGGPWFTCTGRLMIDAEVRSQNKTCALEGTFA